MSPRRTPASTTQPPLPALEPVRLARAERREALLDAALALVAAGEVDSVSVESVADRAGVSRPLVYKHFANRSDILTALYVREGSRLHDDLSVDVQAAASTQEKYRALCRGSLRAVKERGRIFEGLRSAASMTAQLRRMQRERDRQTVAFYTRHTARELAVPASEAEPVAAMLLGAIAPLLNLWLARPTDDHAAALEDAYMRLVVGALQELGRHGRTGTRRPAARSRAARSTTPVRSGGGNRSGRTVGG